MTRAEQAAEKVRKAQEKRAEAQRRAKEKDVELAELERQAAATVREETRKATNKRRYHVGAVFDEAGLFAWSNAELVAVAAVLSRFAGVPNPATVLEGLLVGDSEFLAEKLYIAPITFPSESEVRQEGKIPIRS